jgi:cytochrome b561
MGRSAKEGVRISASRRPARFVLAFRAGAQRWVDGAEGDGVMASLSRSHAVPLRYSASAKFMHWFVAAAVIALLTAGPVMKRLVPEGSLRDNLYNFHEALGALVLIVMVVRLARRMAFGVPAPDAAVPPVEQQASLWAQYALYVLLLLTTVLGWAGTNAYGDPVSVFGLFDFPAIIGKDQPLSDRIFVWHLICGILIGAIVALHVAGALYHWLVKRDRVLQRMLPGN